jgi:hypothetical protein
VACPGGPRTTASFQGALLGTFASGHGLTQPSGLAIGSDTNLYVNSNGTNQVFRFDGTTGAFIDVVVAAGSGGLSKPTGLTFGPDHNLYVASNITNNILRYGGTTGQFLGVFASGGGLVKPDLGLIFGPDGNLYVSSNGTNQVLRYNGVTGQFMGVFVAAGSGGLVLPAGLAFGHDGNLYVSSNGGRNVLRYSGTNGTFLGQFVAPGSGGLAKPTVLAFGPDGNLYVNSHDTNRVVRYDGTTGNFINAFAGGPELVAPTGLVFNIQTVGRASRFFATGGGPGRVVVYGFDNTRVVQFLPYGASYTGPVTVAVGDINGDGIPDLVTGAAVGNPDVRVYDGAAFANGTFDPNNPNASLLAEWFPYAISFNVGANVAVGDIEHDGFADIVTGADVGNPDVRVYRGRDIAMHTFNPNGASLIAQWFPYGLNFNVGANVAVGDVNGDGFADVVTGATAGNPDVRVYNGQDIANGTFNPNGSSLLAQFFPYALQFNVGAFVAVGDTTGSGFGDVITGASIGNPDVRVYSGQDIAQGTFNPDTSLRNQFFAYATNQNIGVAVAAADFENNGQFDILTGSRQTPSYRVVHGNATGNQPPALFEGTATGLQGGLFVGA